MCHPWRRLLDGLEPAFKDARGLSVLAAISHFPCGGDVFGSRNTDALPLHIHGYLHVGNFNRPLDNGIFTDNVDRLTCCGVSVHVALTLRRRVASSVGSALGTSTSIKKRLSSSA
jgi:hypothetical protein